TLDPQPPAVIALIGDQRMRLIRRVGRGQLKHRAWRLAGVERRKVAVEGLTGACVVAPLASLRAQRRPARFRVVEKLQDVTQISHAYDPTPSVDSRCTHMRMPARLVM